MTNQAHSSVTFGTPPVNFWGVIARKNAVRTCDERGEFSDFCREAPPYFGLSQPLVDVIISLRFGSRIRFRLSGAI